MKTIFAQQATAGAMAVGVESTNKVVFWGMTAPQLVALGTGVILGTTLCYFGYRIYKNKKNDTINIFEKNKTLKSLRELVSKQEHISSLDSKNLKEWFHDNHVEVKDAKLMIAIPSDKVLNAIGYRMDESTLKLDKYIIQSIYNSKSGVVYKLRFVAYDSIESNLQAKLLENNGLVILDE